MRLYTRRLAATPGPAEIPLGIQLSAVREELGRLPTKLLAGGGRVNGVSPRL